MPATAGKPRSGASLDDGTRPPQSIVVSRGVVGRNIQRLVMDLRCIMEPFTAPKLKVLFLVVCKKYEERKMYPFSLINFVAAGTVFLAALNAPILSLCRLLIFLIFFFFH